MFSIWLVPRNPIALDAKVDHAADAALNRPAANRQAQPAGVRITQTARLTGIASGARSSRAAGPAGLVVCGQFAGHLPVDATHAAAAQDDPLTQPFYQRKGPTIVDQIFVFVHRWFRRGEGWAYHPEMESQVRDIAAVVAPRLLRGERGRFDIPLDHGMLLGEIVADTDCENATATARGASIAKVALLPAGSVFRKNVDRLYRALQAVQPPSVEGSHGKLIIKYRGVTTSAPDIVTASIWTCRSSSTASNMTS